RFLAGLLSFLLAHLCYITAFTLDGARLFSWRLLIPFLIYGGIMLRILFPHLGKMKGPVLLYLMVILLMGWQAGNRWLSGTQAASSWAFQGALLFIASDSLLAVNRFKTRLERGQALVMSTYFLAQLMIAMSV
ncbi:MAG TPA: lysoplasmalogenase, partial [Pyrinomonadaceae bacterium]